MKTKTIRYYSIFLFLIITSFISCKKTKEKEDTYTCTSCSQTPEGKAANDNSSKGIYKGVIIGSSGTIKFDIANTNSNSITATMIIDGTSVTLTSATALVAGQLYVGEFKGSLNGSAVSVTFSVGNSGSGPTILSSNIPGHTNVIFSIAKETSTALVRCFEGSFQTSENKKGTFNIIVSTLLKGWTGKAREEGSRSTDDISGTFVNNNLIDESGVTIAPINGDEFSGSFKNSKGTTITVKAKRTL